MKNKKTAVLFDLDSTLCDTRGRWSLSPLHDPVNTWEDYALGCASDIVVPAVKAAMDLHWPHHQIHICSARSNVARQQTRDWLAKHDIKYDYMHLAREWQVWPTKEEALAAVVNHKAGYILDLREGGVEPVLMFEDQVNVAKGITELTGVPVLMVDPALGRSPASERLPCGSGCPTLRPTSAG